MVSLLELSTTVHQPGMIKSNLKYDFRAQSFFNKLNMENFEAMPLPCILVKDFFQCTL